MKNKSNIANDPVTKIYECVVCDTKIDKGRLCNICSQEIDEKKEIIISKNHPFFIISERKTH